MTAAAAGFLDAILADPGDDTVRLIYADWLDEHGQPERAEFIRVQCELAGLPDIEEARARSPMVGMALDSMFSISLTSDQTETVKAVIARREVLRRRERELLRHDDDWWIAEVARPAGLRCDDGGLPVWVVFPHKWRRGFVAALRVEAADWLAHGDALCAAAPIEEVTLADLPMAYMRDLGDDPLSDFYTLSRSEALSVAHPAGGSYPVTSSDPDLRRQIALRLLAERWPRVRFVLPA